MQLTIVPTIFEKYPDVTIGILIIKNLDNTEHNTPQQLLIDLGKELRRKLTLEEIPTLPVIEQWRAIYKSFGANPPSKYRSSVEALLRRITQGELPTINFLVDTYNYISVKYQIPVGAEDLDTIAGNLQLDFAQGNEPFTPLGSQENLPPLPGEVVYKDHKGIICRCWNWREGDRTKITEKTKNAIIVIENALPNTEKNLQTALNELQQLLKQHNTIITTTILDKHKRTVEL